MSSSVPPQLSHTAAKVLHAISAGHVYGFSVIEVTGLASGTVYPALRRLERDGLISSTWEDPSIAEKELRPARKYYSVTTAGLRSIDSTKQRYPLLEKLFTPQQRGKR